MLCERFGQGQEVFDMQFADMVVARLEELGENINSFEKRMGWQQGFLRAVVRSDEKRTIPNMDRARMICDARGLEFYFGPPRTTPQPAEISVDGADFATLPLYAARASAGPGAMGDDTVLRHLLFRRDWLRAIGVSPRDARLLQVQGDSMAPILADGDLVMIDTARALPPPSPPTAPAACSCCATRAAASA